MPSAYETVATALKTIIETEFAVEQFTATFDNLHESLGQTRVEIGIAPVEDSPRETNAQVQETTVEVRFYDFWTKEITPHTEIDPRRITGFAERFRKAIRVQQATSVGTAQTWYFDVRRITYPSDPTGNKSRFHALVRAHGNNAGLVETSG